MPVFTDALLGDTLHLSAEEFGAYCLLLFATWRNNGSAIGDDDRKLARICRVTIRRWHDKLRPVLIPFFCVDDGFWHQKRLEKEWAFVAERARISRSNGAQGGRPTTLNTKETNNPGGSSQDTRKQSTHTHTLESKEERDIGAKAPHPKRTVRGSAEPEGFAEWYEGWPHKVGKQAALRAFAKACRLASLPDLIAAEQRYVHDKPPDRPWCNPATWLNEHRWLDQPANGAINGHDVSQQGTPQGPPPDVPEDWEKRLDDQFGPVGRA